MYTQLDGTPEKKHAEIAEHLGLSFETAREYCQVARRGEKADQKARAWDPWLDCHTQQAIADEIGVAVGTVNRWLSDLGQAPEPKKPPGATGTKPWGNIQHFSGSVNAPNDLGSRT